MNDTINDGLAGIQSSIANVNSNLNGTSRDTLLALGGISSSIQTNGLTTSNLINNATNVVNSNLANGFSSISSDINQQTIGQLNSTNLLNTNLLQTTNATNGVITNSTNQIIHGINDLAKTSAECCCEIKHAICESTSAILANQNDIERLRQSQLLTASQTEVATLKNQIYVNDAVTNGINRAISTILEHQPFYCANNGGSNDRRVA
jgi:hypothetical protein